MCSPQCLPSCCLGPNLPKVPNYIPPPEPIPTGLKPVIRVAAPQPKYQPPSYAPPPYAHPAPSYAPPNPLAPPPRYVPANPPPRYKLVPVDEPPHIPSISQNTYNQQLPQMSCGPTCNPSCLANGCLPSCCSASPQPMQLGMNPIPHQVYLLI